MIRTLLVANRGEIAVRIMQTARRLGIRSVAVYSDADRDALHVAMADTALRIGPAPSRDSYLDQQAILAAARRSGADAIHPGYGFLAENADFAAACVAAGMRFVGPPAEAIRIMGAKDAARRRMQEAGVPVVPGADGEAFAAAPEAAAERVGFPLLIKAAAGGGGKGMRVVRDRADFAAALAAVRREAAAAFGEEQVLLERWLERARHVEVQVFADAEGKVLHLFDRDCSVQRRQQKVLEEAPAPDIPPGLRAKMAEAAVAAAAAVGYVGAGTVEFLLAGEEFYFLEMNTRLQVEHPVTEMITGVDLVAWQLAVAAGEPLPMGQEDLSVHGHAVEVRLYAEDPASGYLPSTGELALLRFPEGIPDVRVDSGVRQGDVVSPHYDPMLAKIAAWGPDRPAALEKLAAALATVQVHGVRSNLSLLRGLLRDPRLQAGPVATTWLEQDGAALATATEAADVSPGDWAAAALGVLARRRPGPSGDPFVDHGPLRLNQPVRERVGLDHDGELRQLEIEPRDGGWLLHGLGDEAMVVVGRVDADSLVLEIDGQRQRYDLLLDAATLPPTLILFHAGGSRRFKLTDALAAELDRDEAVAGSLLAPMPGQVVTVSVVVGDTVAEGDVLMVLEAMKMEHSIRAPHGGVVGAVNFAVGDRVEEGSILAAIDGQEAAQ